MALQSKSNVPEESIEEVRNAEQISFDDLEFEAEYVDEEQSSPKKYFTISGKEQQYEPEWERFTPNDLVVGDTMEGRPEITILEKKDKSYNAMRVRVLDDGDILDCYFNYPKKDYPHVKRLNKDFEFYRPCFMFIFQVLRLRDERNVVDKDGEEINFFNTVNLETFAKYVDQMSRIGIKIVEGTNTDYNDFEIYKME